MTRARSAGPQPTATNIAAWSTSPRVPNSDPSQRYLNVVSCSYGTYSVACARQGPTPPRAEDCAATDWANHVRLLPEHPCELGAAPTQVSAALNLQGQNGVPTSVTVALGQSPSGTLPSPFSIDAFGRLSVGQPGSISLSASFSLNRSLEDGASGSIGALRLPAASVDNLQAPSVLTGGFVDDSDNHATASLTWSGQVLATSIEIDYYNGSMFLEDVLTGSMTVTFDPTAVGLATVEQADGATSRTWLAAGGTHWLDVIPFGGSLVIEAGCPAGWQGRREALGSGHTAQALAEELVAEHAAHTRCVVYGWHVVGGHARLEQLAEQGVLA
jgi:hypothetical protein